MLAELIEVVIGVDARTGGVLARARQVARRTRSQSDEGASPLLPTGTPSPRDRPGQLHSETRTGRRVSELRSPVRTATQPT
jgi:hypothetical protein